MLLPYKVTALRSGPILPQFFLVWKNLVNPDWLGEELWEHLVNATRAPG
jgi:hypothetical protein